MRLKQRLLVLPEAADIVSFVEHEGKPPDAGPMLPEEPKRAGPGIPTDCAAGRVEGAALFPG
jgi:hypothetical protein